MPDPEDVPYDLGTFTRPIKTSHPKSQSHFNQGLTWTYAFNHAEAISCFSRAIAHDQNCTMAYWGLAYALGPNYNKPWEFFGDEERESTVSRAHGAVARARESLSAEGKKGVEGTLVEALEFRYPESAMDQVGEGKGCWEIWNEQYAEAMKSVYDSFPEDLDVAALYADALMNLTPWALWDIHTGQPAKGARTLEIKDVLETALAQEGGNDHPGLLHLYIHLMEMSNAPESAMNMADRLRGLVPDAGHLEHMSSHLDVLCGDYKRAIESNESAVRADEKFVAREGAMNFYTLYRLHDWHFLIYAAMFAGRFGTAVDAVVGLEGSLSEGLLRTKSPPMADWLEGFLSVRVHVLIRFGRWTELLDMPLPDDQELYCVRTAMVHYGKGIAYAVTNQIPAAQQQQTLFLDAVTRVPPSRTLFNNTCLDILAIASEMLNGELEYRCSNFDKAFDHLRKAVSLCDALPYDEPWGWMQPPRHAYGALLLEQDRVEEAAAVYSADLGLDETLPRAHRHPKNIWALHGYHECMIRLGRQDEAKSVEKMLRKVTEEADVAIGSSCFCRKLDASDGKNDCQ